MSANSTFEHLESVISSVSTFSGKKAGNKLCQSMASGETGLATAKEEIMLLMLITVNLKQSFQNFNIFHQTTTKQVNFLREAVHIHPTMPI